MIKKPLLLSGVIGDPISHSKSPRLHGHWLKRYGIDGHYIPLHMSPGDFVPLVRSLPKMGFRGVNVTLPHKEAALAVADSASTQAEKIGSANTLFFEPDGQIRADNTDGYGFIENLTQHAPKYDFKGKTALCLGAGGAARAVLVSMVTAGVAKIWLSNRTQARADALARMYPKQIKVIPWAPDLIGTSDPDIVINTTSLGMTGQPPLEIDFNGFTPEMLVTDLVYTPLETELLNHAKRAGALTVDGVGMLLHQAVPGFEGWFGIKPNVDEDLRRAVLS